MDSNGIRKVLDELGGLRVAGNSRFIASLTLLEIAAQLAELNQNIKLMQQLHTVLRETDDNDIGF